ncbi:MAG: SDR family oxidoreductase [Casimicrobiaceae bacterium]|nr:SDR family oxidoreductase [Casimicrobiaceae bacterium]
MSASEAQRIVVFGATGMLGSMLMRVLPKALPDWEIWGVARTRLEHPRLAGARLRIEPDLTEAHTLDRLWRELRPSVAINAVGIVKQRPEANDPLATISVNALFPHRLHAIAQLHGTRLIHISTDCVFSGRRGGYREEDPPDPEDLYGRSKLLGEPLGAGVLTLRTSIIGPELREPGVGLLSWFLAQRGRVAGYRRAFFSGLPTVVLAQLLADLIARWPHLDGLYHVAAERISKWELLALVRDIYGLNVVELAPEDHVVVDRSLDARKFYSDTGWRAPPWRELVEQMYIDHCHDGGKAWLSR